MFSEQHPVLSPISWRIFDSTQHSILESICNVKLEDRSWLQASLPVNSGGLGIRSVVMLAPSAYLASAAGSSDILKSIPPSSLGTDNVGYPFHQDVIQLWSRGHSNAPPEPALAIHQKCWDSPVVEASVESLIAAADRKSSTRLLVACEKESGAWLTAPPISSVGLRLDDEVVRVAVGLCLGSALCMEHKCRHCGQMVDTSGTHGLSCRQSEGRLPRHSALNDVIHRSLAAIQIPAKLEPTGLCRSDGTRPDGISITPWSRGKALVWDATCHDSFAASNISLSSSKAGAVADKAAAAKRNLYRDLCTSHHFVPVAFETTGVFGKDAALFLKELGNCTRSHTSDPLSYLRLCQRISVTIQRFNCTAILGTCNNNYS